MGISDLSNSGGEIYDYQILKHLAQMGVRISMILPKGRHAGPISGARIKYVSFSYGRYANFFFAKALLQEYRKNRFDVLRIHSPYYVSLAGLIFKFFNPSVPIVVHHHHLEGKYIHRMVIDICARYADRIVTVSEFSRRQLLNNMPSIKPERITVIYNGVDESFKPQYVNSSFLQKHQVDDCKLIVFVGPFIPRKNLLYLLKIFKEVNKKVTNSRLILVGEGPQLNILKKFAIDIGLSSSVIFTGFVSELDKIRWLSAADVFVSTSKMEGFGLSVAEAMACEKPVVVSKAGAFSEVVVDGLTGFVVSLNRIKEFVNAIVKLLENPSLCFRMGKAGRERVLEHFQWNKAAQQIKNLYEELILSKRKTVTNSM